MSEVVLFYHNRFINNTAQARVAGGGQWDAGYLIGGNFWSATWGRQVQRPEPGRLPRCRPIRGHALLSRGPLGASESIDHYPLIT